MADKKKRNDGDSAVYGVSASKEFWVLAERKMLETGLTRSGLIVQVCMDAWGAPESVRTKKPGRPVSKLRKG